MKWTELVVIVAVLVLIAYGSMLTFNHAQYIRSAEYEGIIVKQQDAELLDQIEHLKHDIWHYRQDRDYYKELADARWLELIEGGIYILEYEHTSNFTTPFGDGSIKAQIYGKAK